MHRLLLTGLLGAPRVAALPMYRLLLAFLLLGCANGALAQDAARDLLVVTTEAEVGLVSLDPSPPLYAAAGRSRSGAWTHALVGTLLPVGAGLALVATNASDGIVEVGSLLLLTGVWVGPSAGHFYLGDDRRAWIGLGLRTAAIGAGTLVSILTSNGDLGGLVSTEGALVMTAGFVAGAIYSFATINRSARERGFAVVPGVRPDGGPALTLAARF